MLATMERPKLALVLSYAVLAAYDDFAEAQGERSTAEARYEMTAAEIEDALTTPGRRVYSDEHAKLTARLGAPRRALLVAQQAEQLAYRALEGALVAAALPLDVAQIARAVADLRSGR